MTFQLGCSEPHRAQYRCSTLRAVCHCTRKFSTWLQPRCIPARTPPQLAPMHTRTAGLAVLGLHVLQHCSNRPCRTNARRAFKLSGHPFNPTPQTHTLHTVAHSEESRYTAIRGYRHDTDRYQRARRGEVDLPIYAAAAAARYRGTRSILRPRSTAARRTHTHTHTPVSLILQLYYTSCIRYATHFPRTLRTPDTERAEPSTRSRAAH